MRQLTLQFDGFAQVQQPIDATAARQRRMQAHQVPALKKNGYQQLVTVVRSLRTTSTGLPYNLSGAFGKTFRSLRSNAIAWCKEHQEQLEVYVGGPAIAASCFILYLLAAVLQGGAE